MLKRILSPEEEKQIQIERAEKALKLNGYVKPPYDPKNDPILNKKTIILRKVKPKPKDDSNTMSPLFRRLLNEKARKALELNGGL
jgi:hypothetical protein